VAAVPGLHLVSFDTRSAVAFAESLAVAKASAGRVVAVVQESDWLQLPSCTVVGEHMLVAVARTITRLEGLHAVVSLAVAGLSLVVVESTVALDVEVTIRCSWASR
jgi:hypothetical protein